MFNRGRYLSGEPRGSIFFRLWLLFCGLMTVGVFCLMVWVAFKIVPAVVNVLNHFAK